MNSESSPTYMPGAVQGTIVNLAQAAAVSASTGTIYNPCSPGSIGITQQMSGLNFTSTVAPVACVTGGWTVNGSPSVSFTGTFTDATRASGSGSGPVSSFAIVSSGQGLTCTVAAGQTFTFTAGGQHGTQSGGNVVCNGTTYNLPMTSW